MRCQSSLPASRPPKTIIPALEKKRSIDPNFFSVKLTRLMISLSLRTSQVRAIPFISSATVFAPASFTSATMTDLAPSRAKRRHKPWPIPLAPPVTIIIFPLTSIMFPPQKFSPKRHNTSFFFLPEIYGKNCLSGMLQDDYFRLFRESLLFNHDAGFLQHADIGLVFCKNIHWCNGEITFCRFVMHGHRYAGFNVIHNFLSHSGIDREKSADRQ